VVRNGRAEPRRLLTSSGAIEVHAPPVNDKRVDDTTGERGRSTVDHLQVWADRIHVNIRLDEAKMCLLVMVAVRVDGTTELIAVPEG
jgi:hypothetical protein